MRIGLDIFSRLGPAGALVGAVARPFDWAATGMRIRQNISARGLLESVGGLFAAEEDRWFRWKAVAFVGGDGIYFGLSTESAIWLALGVAALALAPSIWGLRASGGRNARIRSWGLNACNSRPTRHQLYSSQKAE